MIFKNKSNNTFGKVLKIFFIAIITTVISLFIMGCSTPLEQVGFLKKNLKSIDLTNYKENAITKDDIISALGSPNLTSSDSNRYYYISLTIQRNILISDRITEIYILYCDFDKDDNLVSYSSSTRKMNRSPHFYKDKRINQKLPKASLLKRTKIQETKFSDIS